MALRRGSSPLVGTTSNCFSQAIPAAQGQKEVLQYTSPTHCNNLATCTQSTTETPSCHWPKQGSYTNLCKWGSGDTPGVIIPSIAVGALPSQETISSFRFFGKLEGFILNSFTDSLSSDSSASKTLLKSPVPSSISRARLYVLGSFEPPSSSAVAEILAWPMLQELDGCPSFVPTTKQIKRKKVQENTIAVLNMAIGQFATDRDTANRHLRYPSLHSLRLKMHLCHAQQYYHEAGQVPMATCSNWTGAPFCSQIAFSELPEAYWCFHPKMSQSRTRLTRLLP